MNISDLPALIAALPASERQTAQRLFEVTAATGTLVVPEPMRQAIFEPNFVWNPQSPERTGRSLFKVREFAVAHAGSVWVESKTGKACTFFLRVRPDGAR